MKWKDEKNNCLDRFDRSSIDFSIRLFNMYRISRRCGDFLHRVCELPWIYFTIIDTSNISFTILYMCRGITYIYIHEERDSGTFYYKLMNYSYRKDYVKEVSE